METIVYRIDKQQGPTVQSREPHQYPEISHNLREYEKESIYMYN